MGIWFQGSRRSFPRILETMDMPLLLVFFFSNMCARRVGIMMMLWVLRLSMIPIRDSLHGKNNKVNMHGDDEGRFGRYGR